jgi:FkbM family methyltransferase
VVSLDFKYKKGWVPKKPLGEYNALINKQKLENSVAVDVGSAVGVFPIKFHENFSKIYCFDACYKNIQICNYNLEKNNIDNVNCFHFAASNRTGDICKIINNKNAPYNNVCLTDNVVMKSKSQILGKEWHNAVSLNFKDMLTFLEQKSIDFLKVDIEGAEYDFLFEQDLSCVSVLAIELHFLQNEKTKQLKEYILKYFDICSSTNGSKHGEYLMINKKEDKDDFLIKKGQTVNTDLIKWT